MEHGSPSHVVGVARPYRPWSLLPLTGSLPSESCAATINNVETAFGFTYLRNFLSLGTCIFDAKVPCGTVYATLTENINCYAVDLSELARAGLDFEVSDETGLIGVHHTGLHQNGTATLFGHRVSTLQAASR